MRLLSVYSSRHQAAAAAAAAAHPSSQPSAPSPPPRVLPPSLAAGFHATVGRALEACGYGAPGGALCRYLSGAQLCDVGDAAGLFGSYLRFFSIPSPAQVRRALTAQGVPPPGSGLDPDVVVPALSAGLPGVPAAAVLRVAKCGM
jgi:hypothetical protein